MKTIKNSVAAALMLAALFTAFSCRKAELSNMSSASKESATATVSRPFSDYLNAQGITSVFAPPVPDFLGWNDPLGTKPNYYSLVRLASVDYNGTSAAYLASHGGPVINTSVTGTVKETVLSDGRAKVVVNGHAEKALTFTFTDADYPNIDWLNAPLDFGYRANDLLANHNLAPALGTADFTFSFYNDHPGDPIPDMITLAATHIEKFISITFRSTSLGTFHALSGYTEGTQGYVKVNENGLVAVVFKNGILVPVGTTNDAFPVETIDYKLR